MKTRAVLASQSELVRLQSFLDAQLPETCEVLWLVVSAISLYTADSRFRVYTLRESNDETFLAIVGLKKEDMITQQGENKTIWVVVGWSIDDDAMLRLYRTIDVIDWKKDAVFSFNHRHKPYEGILQFFGHRLDNQLYQINHYFLDRSVALNLQSSSLEGVPFYVKRLERHHAALIYDYWPLKHTSTVEHVAEEIEQLPSVGLFLSATDELVSWITGHVGTGMSRLYTMEQHRCKGYAKLVTLHLSKLMAQSGYVPYVQVLVTNTPSNSFFQKLGFQKLSENHSSILMI